MQFEFIVPFNLVIYIDFLSLSPKMIRNYLLELWGWDFNSKLPVLDVTHIVRSIEILFLILLTIIIAFLFFLPWLAFKFKQYYFSMLKI